VLVAVSTMSMAVRERFRELAVLKALGFQRRDLFGFILAEGFGLSVIGGAVGIGGAWAFWTFSDIQQMTNGFLIVFEVTPRIVGMAAAVASVLGVVSSIGPAISVGRMSVVEGLKTLD
jgi:putative ABC transport system permease protein